MKSAFFLLSGTVIRATIGLSVLLGAFGPAAALDRGTYTLEILVDGVPLQEHAARGKRYVEALEGREYAIRLTNRTARRIAVALAVDGLNTIDAKTTSSGEASKWILGPHRSITLKGWQTGSSTARRFFFTTEDKSYGDWLGKTKNLGVITAAVFRERHRPAPIYRHDRRRKSSGAPGEEGSAAPSAPQRSEAGSGADSRSSMKESDSKRRVEMEAEPSDDLAATGIGRAIDHRVRRIHFESEASPAAVMEIRYEYHDALVRLGVLPRHYAHGEDPLDRRERARGFEEMDFAPDPYAPPQR